MVETTSTDLTINQYSAMGKLCSSFLLNAGINNLETWLRKYTGGNALVERPGDGYFMRLGAAVQRAKAPPQPIGQTSYEFIMIGWYTDGDGHSMAEPTIDAITIHCILLDDRRMEVYVYCMDDAVATYAMSLTSAMKSRWTWKLIDGQLQQQAVGKQQKAGGPGGRAHRSKADWREAVEQWLKVKRDGATPREEFAEKRLGCSDATLGYYVTLYNKGEL